MVQAPAPPPPPPEPETTFGHLMKTAPEAPQPPPRRVDVPVQGLALGELALLFGLACLPMLGYERFYRVRRTACAACGSANVVPGDSPRGVELAAAP